MKKGAILVYLIILSLILSASVAAFTITINEPEVDESYYDTMGLNVSTGTNTTDCTYTINDANPGPTNTSIGTSATEHTIGADISSFPSGANTLYVYCEESTNASNNNTVSRVFYKDDEAPQFSGINPADNDTVYDVNNITFEATITDNYADDTTCYLYIDGSLNQTNSSVNNNTVVSFVIDITEVNYASYSWYLNCTEEPNGNIGMTTARTVNVSRSFEDVSIDYTPYINDTNVLEVNFTANANNADLDNVGFEIFRFSDNQSVFETNVMVGGSVDSYDYSYFWDGNLFEFNGEIVNYWMNENSPDIVEVGGYVDDAEFTVRYNISTGDPILYNGMNDTNSSIDLADILLFNFTPNVYYYDDSDSNLTNAAGILNYSFAGYYKDNSTTYTLELYFEDNESTEYPPYLVGNFGDYEVQDDLFLEFTLVKMGPASAENGTLVEFTITVNNTGEIAIDNFELIDFYDGACWDFDEGSNSGYDDYNETDDEVFWDFNLTLGEVKSVNINLTAIDSGSCINEVEFSNSTGYNQTANHSVTISPTVLATASIYNISHSQMAESSIGQEFYIIFNYSEIMDTTVEPNVDLNPDNVEGDLFLGCNGNWLNTTFYKYNCTIADDDNASGLGNVSIDDAEDLAGHIQTPFDSNSGLYTYDMIKPNVTSPYIYGDAYFNGSAIFVNEIINISVNVSDVGAGVNGSSCEYSLNGTNGPWGNAGLVFNGTACIFPDVNTSDLVDGTNIVVRVYDNATNTNLMGNGPAYKDYDAPTTTALGNGGAYNFGDWISTNVTVTLTCDDGSGSGEFEIYYCTDNTNLCDASAGTVVNYTNFPVQVNFSDEGYNYIRYYCDDLLGNDETPQNKSILIDKNAVKINYVINYDDDDMVCALNGLNSPNGNVSIAVNATDEVGVSWVKANLSEFDNSYALVDLIYNGGNGLWEGILPFNDTSNFDFSNGEINITFLADDTAGMSYNSTEVLTLTLYNMSSGPIQNPGCERNGALSTDFCNITDFEHVDFITEIEVNGSADCNPETMNGLPWGDTFQKVITINFSNLNFSDPEIEGNLSQLGDAIEPYITPPGSFDQSYIYVNTSAFEALNVSTQVILYGLPFTEEPNIFGEDAATFIVATSNEPYHFETFYNYSDACEGDTDGDCEDDEDCFNSIDYDTCEAACGVVDPVLMGGFSVDVYFDNNIDLDDNNSVSGVSVLDYNDVGALVFSASDLNFLIDGNDANEVYILYDSVNNTLLAYEDGDGDIIALEEMSFNAGDSNSFTTPFVIGGSDDEAYDVTIITGTAVSGNRSLYVTFEGLFSDFDEEEIVIRGDINTSFLGLGEDADSEDIKVKEDDSSSWVSVGTSSSSYFTGMGTLIVDPEDNSDNEAVILHILDGLCEEDCWDDAVINETLWNATFDTCISEEEALPNCAADICGINLTLPNMTLSFTVGHFSQYNISDNETPVVVISHPTTSNYSSGDIETNITANGTVTQISAIGYYLNGEEVYFVDGNDISDECINQTVDWEVIECLHNITPVNGDNNLTVIVFDYGGGSEPGLNGTDSVAFYIDVIAPTFDHSITNQVAELGVAFNYDLNASDVGGGVDEYFISDEVNFSINAGTGLITNNTFLSVGAYALNVSVDDIFGNTNYSNVFIVNVSDTTGPALVLNSTNVTSISIAGGSILVSAEFIDLSLLDGNITCELYVDSVLTDNLQSDDGECNFTHSVNISNYPNVTYLINATDYYSNTGSSVELVVDVVDDVSPTTPVLTAPEDVIYTDAINYTFTWTVTDTIDKNLTCNLTIDGSVNVSDIFGHTTTVNGFTDGNYSWNVTCWDDADNTNVSETRSFIVDISDPVVSSSTLDDYYLHANQSVNYVVNVSGEDNTTIDTVTAEGNSLTWNGTFWTGSGMMDHDEYVDVIVTDLAGNIGTDNTTTYVVDLVAPVLTAALANTGDLTTNNLSVTQENGIITFSWTINESENLTETNISIDNGIIEDSKLVVGPNIFVTNLSAGTHTVEFTAIDEAGNNLASSIYSFIVNSQENVTELMENIEGANSGIVVNASLTSSTGGELTGDQWMNETFNLELEINVSDVYGFVEIINFSGLDANWNQTDFVSIINISSAVGNNITYNSGLNLSTMVLFVNASSFLDESNFGNGVKIFVNQSLGDLDVLYFADDEGQKIYNIDDTCNVSGPGVAVTLDNMCYYNTSNNVTIWVPHLSGVGLGNDTIAPTLTVNNPSGALGTSYFKYNLTVAEANPITSGTYCWYSLNSTGTQYDLTYNSFDATGVSHNYVQSSYIFTGLLDGSYNLTTNCTDDNGNTVEEYTIFTVSDSTDPGVTFEDATSIDTDSAEIDVVATYNYDEVNYSIEYGTDSDDLDLSDSSSTFDDVHTISLSSLSADTTYYYNITACDVNGNCVSSGIESFATAEEDDEVYFSGSSFWTSTYSAGESELEEGFTKEVGAAQRMRVRVDGEVHYVGVISLTTTSATINVSSTPQQKVFSVGETHKFDVNDNGYYDLSVTLESISNNKANIYTVLIHEEVPVPVLISSDDGDAVGDADPVEQEIDSTVDADIEPEDLDDEEEQSNTLFNYVLLVIILVAIAAIIFFIVTIRRR